LVDSFGSDNRSIRNNWNFFQHAFINPDSKYLCGCEVQDIQELCSSEFDHLILCDIMCPEYYVDLLASCGQHSPSIYWLLPYEYYEHTYDYIPKYACTIELCHVADDLADECLKTFESRDNLVVIQTKDFGKVFFDELRRSGFHIRKLLDATCFYSGSDKKNYQFKHFISYCKEEADSIVILDQNPMRQYKIAALFYNELTGSIPKVVSLNEFLFTNYTLHETLRGIRIK